MGVGRFEAFIPWVSDAGLRSLCHGLYMGVGRFEAFIPWVSDAGLRSLCHGLYMGVRWFEAFIPWVGHESQTVWGLHSMGWMWESDGLKLKFHGLYVGV